MRRRLQQETREWLGNIRWTHFVTLAFNDPMLPLKTVRSKLRDWDARMNSGLLGGRWQKRRDERLLWCAFPEKLEVNPHWHLCLEVLPEQIDHLSNRGLDSLSFEDLVDRSWRSLVKSGSVNVQAYEDGGVLRYVTKSFGSDLTFDNFVHSKEFIGN